MKNTDTQSTTPTEETENNQPDYIVMQYRVIRVDDGWRTRKDRIGVAWKNNKEAILFRPSGMQVIDGDFYFFPNKN